MLKERNALKNSYNQQSQRNSSPRIKKKTKVVIWRSRHHDIMKIPVQLWENFWEKKASILLDHSAYSFDLIFFLRNYEDFLI